LKYFPSHLVPVLASTYKQNILHPVKATKVCYSLAELEFIWVDGAMKFIKHFKGGTSYKSFGTSVLYKLSTQSTTTSSYEDGDSMFLPETLEPTYQSTQHQNPDEQCHQSKTNCH
jgi:hypothetical protein